MNVSMSPNPGEAVKRGSKDSRKIQEHRDHLLILSPNPWRASCHSYMSLEVKLRFFYLPK
jgi:hypothetical protein